MKNNILYLYHILFHILGISSVWSCSNFETQLVNHTARIINVEPTNAAVKHSVGGSVKIISGCVFYVRNMTVMPSGNGLYWWGIPRDNNTEPYPRVVTAALGGFNGQGIYFTLDQQYSFNDIAIMEMRSEGDNRAYGAWAITGDVKQYYGVDADTSPVLDFESKAATVRIGTTLTIFFVCICQLLMY